MTEKKRDKTWNIQLIQSMQLYIQKRIQMQKPVSFTSMGEGCCTAAGRICPEGI